MPRRKKQVSEEPTQEAPKSQKALIQLPAQAKQDAKTIAGIVDRWAKGGEEVVEDILNWGKKHKFLLLFTVAIVAVGKYLFDEPKRKQEEEDY